MTKRLWLPIVTLWSAALVLAAQLHPVAQGRGGAPVSLPDGAGKGSGAGNMQQVPQPCAADGWFRLHTRRLGESCRLDGRVAASRSRDRALVSRVEFPEKNRPKSVIVPGKAQVSFKEWIVPSLGSRPHDPLATPDGAIWWTGQWANVLGRVDPRNGDLKEFRSRRQAQARTD
jgi:hypothetical protein